MAQRHEEPRRSPHENAVTSAYRMLSESFYKNPRFSHMVLRRLVDDTLKKLLESPTEAERFLVVQSLDEDLQLFAETYPNPERAREDLDQLVAPFIREYIVKQSTCRSSEPETVTDDAKTVRYILQTTQFQSETTDLDRSEPFFLKSADSIRATLRHKLSSTKFADSFSDVFQLRAVDPIKSLFHDAIDQCFKGLSSVFLKLAAQSQELTELSNQLARLSTDTTATAEALPQLLLRIRQVSAATQEDLTSQLIQQLSVPSRLVEYVLYARNHSDVCGLAQKEDMESKITSVGKQFRRSLFETCIQFCLSKQLLPNTQHLFCLLKAMAVLSDPPAEKIAKFSTQEDVLQYLTAVSDIQFVNSEKRAAITFGYHRLPRLASGMSVSFGDEIQHVEGYTLSAAVKCIGEKPEEMPLGEEFTAGAVVDTQLLEAEFQRFFRLLAVAPPIKFDALREFLKAEKMHSMPRRTYTASDSSFEHWKTRQLFAESTKTLGRRLCRLQQADVKRYVTCRPTSISATRVKGS